MSTQVKFPIVIDGFPKFWADPSEAEHFASLGTVRVWKMKIADQADADYYGSALSDASNAIGQIIFILTPTIDRVWCLGDLGPPIQNELSRRYAPPEIEYRPAPRKTIFAATVHSINARGSMTPSGRGLSVRKRKAESQYEWQ